MINNRDKYILVGSVVIVGLLLAAFVFFCCRLYRHKNLSLPLTESKSGEVVSDTGEDLPPQAEEKNRLNIKVSILRLTLNQRQ